MLNLVFINHIVNITSKLIKNVIKKTFLLFKYDIKSDIKYDMNCYIARNIFHTI